MFLKYAWNALVFRPQFQYALLSIRVDAQIYTKPYSVLSILERIYLVVSFAWRSDDDSLWAPNKLKVWFYIVTIFFAFIAKKKTPVLKIVGWHIDKYAQ